jgi:hypothetical protein
LDDSAKSARRGLYNQSASFIWIPETMELQGKPCLTIIPENACATRH